MRAVLFADELLVHDFLELDHCGGVCGRLVEGFGRVCRRAWVLRVVMAKSL